MKKGSTNTIFIVGFLTGLFFSFLAILLEPNLPEFLSAKIFVNKGMTDFDIKKALSSEKQIYLLEKRINKLKDSYQALKPKKPYLIVNTSDNEVNLMSGNKLILNGKCSTGSYILLKAGNNREWLFKTPRGIFKVTVKLKYPIWYKPDWAYLEEGLPIPTRYTSARYEKGVLGDLGVAFGGGYLIHGTPYKRLIGMPVTHGCIRLGDEDLEIVYNTMEHASKIFIY